MRRLVQCFLDLFVRRFSPRTAVLDVAIDLQRISHRLFEITQSLRRPTDLDEMFRDEVPRTVEAEIWGILDLVRDEFLSSAIEELVKVAEVTEEQIREEFFKRHHEVLG